MMQPWRIARITFLEVLRKKDFYVLVILLSLYALIAWALLETADAAGRSDTEQLLLSLGLTFSFASSAILVVVLAARQLPKEIEQRTILPLLARPISRGQFLAGKFLACWIVGIVALLCFVVLIRAVVPSPERFSEALFAQTILLKIAGLGALAAVTILLSLFLPESLNVTLALGYYFLWGLVFNMLRLGLTEAGGLGRPVSRLLYVFPHLEALNISRLCLSQAAPLAWGLVFALIAYAAAYAVLALAAAHHLFERRWI